MSWDVLLLIFFRVIYGNQTKIKLPLRRNIYYFFNILWKKKVVDLIEPAGNVLVGYLSIMFVHTLHWVHLLKA